MKENNLEQLFNDGLNNLESDVNPNAWSKIEAGLKAPAEPTPAITSAVKGGLFNYTGLLLTVAAAGIITAVYFGTKKSDNGEGQPLASTQVVKEQPSSSVVITEQPVASEIQTSTNSSQKQPATSTVKQKATPEIKKATVADTKNDAHSNVAAPVNTSQTTAAEPKPTVNTHSSTPSTTPAANETSAKPNTSNETKGTPAVTEKTMPTNTDVPKPELKIYWATGLKPEEGDEWGPKGEDVKEFIMTIYDSKGDIAFNPIETSEMWNGKLKNGELAPEGEYRAAVKLVDVNNVPHSFTKKFKLVR